MIYLRTFTFVLVSLFFACHRVAGAGELLQLQPMLYIFKNSEFHDVTVAGASARTEGRSMVIKSPSEIHFDGNVLKIQGQAFTWSTGASAPSPINLITSPIVQVGYNQPATLRCVAPTQYMEKAGDGLFALREIAANSPDVPRYVLSFTVAPGPADSADLSVTLRIEIVSIQAREKLSHVDLEIGKPTTKSFNEEVNFTVQKGEWNALMIRTKDNDYSALTLLKITSAPAASEQSASGTASAGAGKSIKVRTLAETSDAAKHFPLPSKENPVKFIAYDGGMMELGKSIAGEDAPTPAQMRTALLSALEMQGYEPGTSDSPAAIALIYHWGLTHTSIDSGSLNLGEPMKTYETFHYFFVVSAYEYADLKERKKTLLWRTDVDTEDAGSLSTDLVTLVAASGPFLGRNFRTRQLGSVTRSQVPKLSDAVASRSIGGPTNPVDPALDESVRSIIDAQHRILEWKSYLPFSTQDQIPHQPIPSK